MVIEGVSWPPPYEPALERPTACVLEPRRSQPLDRFTHYLVSPLAQTEVDTAGRSLLSRDTMQAAARYCLAHPRWRLSTQMHKLVGLR